MKLKHIGVIVHKSTPLILQTLKEVIAFLQPLELSISVCPNAKTWGNLSYPKNDIPTLAQIVDLLIVIGGDGSMLATAAAAANAQTPMVGINCGRKGFLADVSPRNLSSLHEIIHGIFKEESRLLLTLPQIQQYALNDIVLSQSGPDHQMLHFDLSIDGHFVCHHQANGLIIATPTGSTAYALSAGGSILHPSLPAIILVPICAHRLNTRPIVIPAHSQIDIQMTEPNHPVSLHADGRHVLFSDQDIHIQLAADSVRLRHPRSYNYYDTLTRKLHWESDELDT